MLEAEFIIEIKENAFVIKNQAHTLVVQEWGENAVRVIDSPTQKMDNKKATGIEELNRNTASDIKITKRDDSIELHNNKLTVTYDKRKLTFYYRGQKILEELSRKQTDVRRTVGVDDHIPINEGPSSSLNVSPRVFEYLSDKSYKTTLLFEGDLREKIYGMGGYQEESLNKNNGVYELMQRNSQTTIPFYISNKNYSFIWNSSSVGRATFTKNSKVWESYNSDKIDYIVTAGDTPKELVLAFTEMTGRPPMINEDLLGLWQSKLRYQTTSELVDVYEGYKQRDIALSVLVIDYFHWTEDGNFEFDLNYWNGIEEFTDEIKNTNTKLMVSLWPTVTKNSKYYNFYKNNKMLIQGINGQNAVFDNKEILDFSNPLTRKHLKELLNQNYKKIGVDLFWADQAEPEMDSYYHKNYLTYEGNLEKIGNKFPYFYVKAVQSDGNSDHPVLIRSSWFNSQKYGALAWSGDVDSSFNSLRRQIQVGLSMGVSGMSWWTSDIGGFHSGDSSSDTFKELLIRWFQFATFSPILRMHGDRQPHSQRLGSKGGGLRTSGAANEIWSYGDEIESILTRFIAIRENLKEYLISLFLESSEKGYPIMRPLFFEFPKDPKAWDETCHYMLGPDLLVAPVVEEKVSEMTIYLPEGHEWIEAFSGVEYQGGREYLVEITIKTIPVFYKKSSSFFN